MQSPITLKLQNMFIWPLINRLGKNKEKSKFWFIWPLIKQAGEVGGGGGGGGARGVQSLLVYDRTWEVTQIGVNISFQRKM